MEAHKTNAVRILERLGIDFELRRYEVDLADLSAETVAAKIGLPVSQVFKTLVARGVRKGVCLAVIPGCNQLDLKALALVTLDKKVETVPMKELQSLTGYIRGAVTALGCKRAYPVYLDATSLQQERIAVSAGVRGMQILIAPHDYIRATKAAVAAISRVKNHGASDSGTEEDTY